MIPLYLSFEAFGPYVKKQEMDFSRLAGAGLFLIYGETGSGKTSILDAMCYALFGQSSGGSRGDLASMRSDFAPEDAPMSVEFVFEAGGKKYKFTRGVEIRMKRSGGREARLSQNAFFEDDEGNFAPFFENPKLKNVRSKAEEILGLSYEQFRQVIVLPQGQFESLLVADSAAKEQILSTLFHADDWDVVTGRLCEMAAEMKRENDKAEARIENMLSQFDCADEEGFSALIEENKKGAAEVGGLLKEADRLDAGAQKALSEAAAILKTFGEHDLAVAEHNNLVSEGGEYGKDEERLKKAADAQKVAPYRKNAARMKAILEKREENCAAAEKNSAAARAAYGALMERLRGHLAYLYAESGELAKRVEAKNKKAAEARQLYELTKRRYLDNIAFALAETLVDGRPCPVCGSGSHPMKAESHGSIAGAEDLSRAESYVEECRGELDKEKSALQAVVQEIGECEAEAHETRISEAAGKKDDKAALLAAINKAAQSMGTAEALLMSAGAERANAEEQFERSMDEYREECAKYGFTNDEQVRECSIGEEEREGLKHKIESYKSRLMAAGRRREELEEWAHGAARPDMEAVEQNSARAAEAKRNLVARSAQLAARLELMEESYGKVRVQSALLDEQKREYAGLDGFARLLRGDFGVGIKRYVLGVMLSSVTAEANKLLKLAHNGRYQLYRSSEGAGRERRIGLSLEVFDSHTGERRSVISLSGGEKFLVALALSLGLAAVVQARNGGIRMDAMFIDEGFGMLDPDSIEDALSILTSVMGGSRLIGIISHVEALRENVSALIEVKKTNRGSALRVVY